MDASNICIPLPKLQPFVAISLSLYVPMFLMCLRVVENILKTGHPCIKKDERRLLCSVLERHQDRTSVSLDQNTKYFNRRANSIEHVQG